MVKGQQRFEVQEEVYGKWPGSSLYYKGKVKNYDSSADTYTILFDNDDSDIVISAKDLMSKEMIEKTRKSGRKSSRSRSPGRRRSRSRSPARSKNKIQRSIETDSPQYPTKRSRSPSRKLKEYSVLEEKVNKRSPRSPARRISQQKVSMRNAETSVVLKRVESEKSAAIETISTDVITSFADSTVETTSYIGRLEDVNSISDVDTTSDITTRLRRRPLQESSVSQEKRRVTTRSMSRSFKEEDHFSGDEKTTSSKEEESPSLFTTIKLAFRHVLIFNLQIISMFLPVVILLALYQSCNKKRCTLAKWPKVPKIEKLFTTESFGFVFGFFLLEAILSSLPLGKLVYGPAIANKSRLQFRLNALPSFIISLIISVVLVKFKYLSMVFVVNKLLALIVASCVFGFFLGVAVLVHSSIFPNSKEKSGGIMSDFLFGRFSNPRFFNGKLDVKMYQVRAGAISWGLLVLYYFFKAWNLDGLNMLKTNTSLFLLTIFQVLYILKLVYFEEAMLYTYTVSTEKVGYFLLTGTAAVFPFYYSFQSRYLSMYPVSMPWYCYVIPVLMHVCGAYIYTLSDLQKFNFRKDLQSSIASGVTHIKTVNGKHILVDGWWAKLRHPNYFGDWLMNVSWGLLCGFHHIHGWLLPILLTIQLVYMLKEDDKRCQEKYKSSWDEYRSRVKYSFIPYVY